MAGQRQPIELVLAKGNKHLTKAEIEARRNSEVKALAGDITPPAYLTKKQKGIFSAIRARRKTGPDSLKRRALTHGHNRSVPSAGEH